MGRRWQEDLPKHQNTSSGVSFSAAQAKTPTNMQKGSKMTPKRDQNGAKTTKRPTQNHIKKSIGNLAKTVNSAVSQGVNSGGLADSARLADGGGRGGPSANYSAEKYRRYLQIEIYLQSYLLCIYLKDLTTRLKRSGAREHRADPIAQPR